MANLDVTNDASLTNNTTLASTDRLLVVDDGTTALQDTTISVLSAYLAALTQTFTNKRITSRVVTVTQSATPTINTDNGDIFDITGLAQAITSFTTNLSGTPIAGQRMTIEVTDNGTARALTFGSSFAATTVSLPTTTVISTRLRMQFEWSSVTSKWELIGKA